MPSAPSTAALRHLLIRASADPPEGLYIWQLFNVRYIDRVLPEISNLYNLGKIIFDLQEEFEENDSELETAARESIGAAAAYILEWFEIDLDAEEAIRERDW